MWNMEKIKITKFQSRWNQTTESDVKEILKHENSNDPKDKKELIIKTISSPVGIKNSALMLEKDKIIVLGGGQIDGNFASSNQVLELMFRIKKIKN